MTQAACGREPLVDAIVRFVAREQASDTREIRACLERAIDESGPDAIERMAERLARSGSDWTYYPRDPLARRIHRELAPRVMKHDPIVTGTEHLDTVAGRPVVIMANHLSYSDANVLDVVLLKVGAASFGGSSDRYCRAEGVFERQSSLLEPLLRPRRGYCLPLSQALSGCFRSMGVR